MLISGLQKLTLLDYPGLVACTVFTGGCNFRCPFCHNAPLVLPEELAHDTDEEQVLSFLKKRVGVLDGVAITGGEPLLHSDIGAFSKKVRALGFRIKLDTNRFLSPTGSWTSSARLWTGSRWDTSRTRLSLYAKTAGIGRLDLDAIERSKDFLLSGSVDYEFRTTVVKAGTRAASRRGKMDKRREGVLSAAVRAIPAMLTLRLAAYDEAEMHSLADAAAEYVPSVQVRGV